MDNNETIKLKRRMAVYLAMLEDDGERFEAESEVHEKRRAADIQARIAELLADASSC